MRTEQLKRLWTKLGADKKNVLILAAGAVGLLLLLLSSGSGQSKKTEKAEDWKALSSSLEQTLEKRAERLLATVEGVGKAEVVITLKSLEAQVYAQNRDETAEGRVSDEYVILSGSGAEAGLREKILLPEIRGVAVSCAGGGSPQVCREVSALLCAAFGVPANRVHVSPMAP